MSDLWSLFVVVMYSALVVGTFVGLFAVRRYLHGKIDQQREARHDR